MSDDDIIALAKKAGMEYNKRDDELRSNMSDGVYLDQMKDFYAIVESQVREECAKLVEKIPDVKEYKDLKWAARVFAFYIRERRSP